MRKKLIVALSFGLFTVTAFAAQRGGRVAKSQVSPFSKQALATPRASVLGEVSAQLEAQRYRGLAVATHPEATGPTLRLQRLIGDQLSRLDFVPAERVAHFRWLDRYPTVLTGWDGAIEQTTPTPDGVLVTMKVYPRHTAGWIAAVDDQAVEHYLYADGQLRYLGSEDDRRGGQPKVMTIN